MPYQPKIGDYVETATGYRGDVIGLVRGDPNHVWVGTRVTALGYYAHELRLVEKPGLFARIRRLVRLALDACSV